MATYYYADVDNNTTLRIEGNRGSSWTTFRKSDGTTQKVPSTRVFSDRSQAQAMIDRANRNRKSMAVEQQARNQNVMSYLVNEVVPERKCTDDVYGDEARDRFKKDLKYYNRPSNW